MMKAPLRPGTRPVGAAQLAVKDTSADGPVFAATPKGDGLYLLTLYDSSPHRSCVPPSAPKKAFSS